MDPNGEIEGSFGIQVERDFEFGAPCIVTNISEESNIGKIGQ